MKTISNVKAIRFQVLFNGDGCVNYDAGEQKSTLSRFDLYAKSAYNNQMFAKKEFGYDINGEMGFKYKVSSECLRHNIFRKSMPFVTSLANTNPELLAKLHSQPDYILRGYMATRGEDKTALKRKSPLTITDAVEYSDYWRKFADFDFHSNAGDKGEKNDEKGNTSIYKIENVGKLMYIADANLDVEELQFISCDPIYDRQAFDNEIKGKKENPYLEGLAKSMVDFTPEVKEYALDNDTLQMANEKDQRGEFGVRLNQESVNMLIHRMFDLVRDVNIYKRNAMFEFSKFISVKIVTTDGVVEIHPDEIDDLYFEYAEAYKPIH